MARGKLKIFFGAFPGAGKTNAMLTAARRMREAGRDVVVAGGGTHGRPDTREVVDGFQILPPPPAGGGAGPAPPA